MDRYTVRFRFSKAGDLVYVSHKDTHRLLERAFRRASLAMLYSEGFNPHPRISIISALSLGITGEEEFGEVLLDTAISEAEFIQRCNPILPPGIHILEATCIQGHERTYPTAAEYHIQNFDTDISEQRIAEIMDRKEIFVTRRKKFKTIKKNIRPFIDTIQRCQGNTLILNLHITPLGTARIEEILKLLGIEPAANGIRIARKRLHIGNKENSRPTC